MRAFTANKQPALHREPIIPELVVSDLKAMDKSGNFDKNVLLWLQDSFTNKALAGGIAHLGRLQKSLVDAGESPDVVQAKQRQELASLTEAAYAAAKAGGHGVDLKTYLEAAKTFYEAESARYGDHLNEIALLIKQALENGQPIDVDRYARTTYLSLAKLSGVMTHLEGLSGKPAAQAVAQAMKNGIERINFVTIGDQPTSVGRELLKMVDTISQNPRQYIEFRDPRQLEMPDGLWDFEPLARDSHSYDY
jgi:hypothetical protein